LKGKSRASVARFLFTLFMITFHIISLFPKSFDSYINESILKRAREKKLINMKFYDPHRYGEGKWKKVDGRPYSGGPGMVLLAPPLLKAAEKAKGKSGAKKKWKTIIFSPGGKNFTNTAAKDLIEKKCTDIILICGRYEGIDARVKKILKAEEISIGEYILTGGELPAMVFMDAVSRQIKGVLGKFESLEENRISSHEVYTRPETLEYKSKKYRVPKVLLTGDHKKIQEWKQTRT
jgi:tRNA (guanine37-N1)-methyltransferase